VPCRINNLWYHLELYAGENSASEQYDDTKINHFKSHFKTYSITESSNESYPRPSLPVLQQKLYPYRKAAKVAFILFQKLFLAIVLPMTFLKPKHVLF
jgi:hypothetical protein